MNTLSDFIIDIESRRRRPSAHSSRPKKGAIIMPSNNNGRAGGGFASPAGAHGQAALILVESLIHGLMERSVLTPSNAVEIVATAIEVQADVAEAADGSAEEMWRSYSLLSSIAESLKQDVGADQHIVI